MAFLSQWPTNSMHSSIYFFFKLTNSIFCDLSKAFDVISHKIVSTKLDYYGFRELVQMDNILLDKQTTVC